jgi:hypothetical protein
MKVRAFARQDIRPYQISVLIAAAMSIEAEPRSESGPVRAAQVLSN